MSKKKYTVNVTLDIDIDDIYADSEKDAQDMVAERIERNPKDYTDQTDIEAWCDDDDE